MEVTESVAMPRDFVFVDFKVKREEWNRYELQDENGSILKMKFVLINVFMEKDFRKKIEIAGTEKEKAKLGFRMQSQNIIGVEVPFELRGEPSTQNYTLGELRASVVKEDIDFEVITERWNIYELADGILEMKVRNSPINVSRTNKFDVQGLPIYMVDSTVNVKLSRLKKVRR